jgi:hypothetical protein
VWPVFNSNEDDDGGGDDDDDDDDDVNWSVFPDITGLMLKTIKYFSRNMCAWRHNEK